MFKDELAARIKEVIKPKEGVCGICHAIAEEVCQMGGSIVAYEQPSGILARILDDEGNIIGEGFDIVWSPAVLRALIDTGIIPPEIEDDLKRDGTSTKEKIELVADMYGYGRVVSAAVIALTMINEMGGRTLIRREGLGVVAIFRDELDEEIVKSPVSYCPTCAVVVGAAITPFIAERIKEVLKDKENTGKKKYELGIENRYELQKGHVEVTLKKGDLVLAERVLGCCMAYGTVKAEIAADLVPEESAKQFKIYCNLCPFKHCWMDKPMGATGNIILHRLSKLGTEVEVTAKGGIVARIPNGDVIEGRGTLCSLSALTNMLLRGDAQKILKPTPGKKW